MHMRGFRAISCLCIASNFDFQDVKRGSKIGFKENIQYLVSLCLTIRRQQATRGTASTEATNPIESTPKTIGIIDVKS